jgi:hypothetical protein
MNAVSGIRRTLLMLGAALAASPAVAGAQETAAPDTAGINPTLRAFYFNLAHRDWGAIASQALSAKVVAHRPPPEAMVADAAAAHSAPMLTCDAAGSVDGARIAFMGDWAEVSVGRCPAGTRGVDEFRLVRFERSWRIVYIRLFEEPGGANEARPSYAGPAD